ncbi:MAG: peptidylprolyl isomerase [Gemmatimonadaceae bacterium]
MRSRFYIGIAACGVLLTACEGLKEALTAHVDVVARAGSQELSVTRLGDLLGNAKIQIPVTRETAAIVADIWTGFQQLAYAAAHNDSLSDHKAIDVAIAPILNIQKLQRFMDSVQKTLKVDSATEAAYNNAAGGLLAARHILIAFKNPGGTVTPAEKDSARKKADQVRAQVTAANFTQMADKYSGDPGVKQNRGNYGVFDHGAMVPQFEDATKALKPGEISQPVESQFGFHIIQRYTYPEAKAEFASKYTEAAQRVADTTYMSQLATASNIEVKDGAAAALKVAVKDQSKHRDDKSAAATYKGGTLTIGDLLGWIETFPPQQQMAQRIPQAPDSALKPFIKQMAVQQVLLARADSAHVQIPQPDKDNMYTQVGQLVGNIWQALGVDPKSLADSAKSTPEKERLAASRADAYLDKMLAGQAQPISPPLPLRKMLDAKYTASVNSAGLDRALERAQRVRSSADSARTANQPKSEIPMPGGAKPPEGAPQPPAAPPPQPDTKKPAPKKP